MLHSSFISFIAVSLYIYWPIISLTRKGASQVAPMVKNLLANAADLRDMNSIPGSERAPRRGHCNPLQYSCLKNPLWGHTEEPGGLPFMGLHRNLAAAAAAEDKAFAYNVGDPGLIPGSGRSPRKGNGNPLQYCCLENPMN